ncbi:MAG TPA: FKBP-type peptidyl-prolyl cis-trans isomerase [Gemmatimonadales bacterium]|nr:FKBP-type peptidyl-prolyl cis-trans isomerase [Gemmatimonadales bacterium]
MRKLRALIIATAALLAACEGGTGPGFEGNITGQPETVSFTESLGVNLSAMTRAPSGYYYQDLAVGAGELAARDETAAIRYTGWLPNGRRFDAGQINAQLNGEALITGFNDGVIGMRVGGRRLLVIPPELGYRNSGQGVIPANAVLVFNVELLAVSRPEPD